MKAELPRQHKPVSFSTSLTLIAPGERGVYNFAETHSWVLIVSYLSAMTSVAALLSWICMLITYLSWYRGSVIAMETREGFKDTTEAKYILEHRGFLQPYVREPSRYRLSLVAERATDFAV